MRRQRIEMLSVDHHPHDVSRWRALWSVSNLLVPTPSTGARRALLTVIALCTIVIASGALLPGWTRPAEPHFVLSGSDGALLFVYALLASAFVGGMGCRQQLLSRPSSLLFPLAGHAIVAATCSLSLLGWSPAVSGAAWLAALVMLELATLPFAARLWGLGFARRPATSLPLLATVSLLAYHGVLITVAAPLAELLVGTSNGINGGLV